MDLYTSDLFNVAFKQVDYKQFLNEKYLVFHLVGVLLLSMLITTFIAYGLTYYQSAKVDSYNDDIDDMSEDEYETESEDNSSTYESESEQSDSNKVEFPMLTTFFNRMKKRKLVRIVGMKYHKLNKTELTKLAIIKFKNFTIDNSLSNFPHFNNIENQFVERNHMLFKKELNKLFTYSENYVNKNLVPING